MRNFTIGLSEKPVFLLKSWLIEIVVRKFRENFNRWCIFPCWLMCKVTLQFDWTWKTTPKGLFKCQNLSTGSEVMEMYFSMSADVQSNLTIWLDLKNYPKRTLQVSKSVHWIRSYGDVFFHVSWCVQWPHHLIWLEKLPQNDSSIVKICPLDQKIEWK